MKQRVLEGAGSCSQLELQASLAHHHCCRLARLLRMTPPRAAANPDVVPQEPKELQKLFEANYDLLLSIFNPQGHLDITYLDATHRVGRDDKGNVFYLERAL